MEHFSLKVNTTRSNSMHGSSVNTTEYYKDEVSEVSRQSWRWAAGAKYRFPTGNKTRWRTEHSKIS